MSEAGTLAVLFTIEDAAKEERERLEGIISEADAVFVDAIGRLDIASAAKAEANTQTGAQQELGEHLDDMLERFGRNSTLDVRSVDAGDDGVRDAYDRLVELLRSAGYDLDISNQTFNTVTGEWEVPPGDAAETFIIYRRLGAVVDWVEGNVPDVSGPRTAEDVSTAQARMDQAKNALVAAQQSLDALNADPAGWVKGSGRYSEDDFPSGTERDQFVDASPALTDQPGAGHPQYDFGSQLREAPSTPTVPEPPAAADEPGAGHPQYDFGSQAREASSTLTVPEPPAADPPPDPVGDTPPFEPVDLGSYAASFGYGARFLTTDPADALFEVAEILRKASVEGWDMLKLQQAISQTDWSVETLPRARELQSLESIDPQAAGVLIDTEADKIRMAAQSLGLVLDAARVNQIARRSYIEQWSSYEVGQNMLLEANWEPGAAGGMVEDNLVAVNALADDYMVGHLLTDESRQGWAEKLYLGDESAESLGAEFSRLAKSTFPMLTDRLDKGYTMQEILSPYRAEIARHLELLDPSGIDFVNDEKYQPFLYGAGVDGTSMLTIADVGQYIRTDAKTRPLWERTDKAKGEARSFADFIGRKFGGLG